MRREFMSDDELESKLREHGVASLYEVAAPCMESDGETCVIMHKSGEQDEVRRTGLR